MGAGNDGKVQIIWFANICVLWKSCVNRYMIVINLIQLCYFSFSHILQCFIFVQSCYLIFVLVYHLILKRGCLYDNVLEG